MARAFASNPTRQTQTMNTPILASALAALALSPLLASAQESESQRMFRQMEEDAQRVLEFIEINRQDDAERQIREAGQEADTRRAQAVRAGQQMSVAQASWESALQQVGLRAKAIDVLQFQSELIGRQALGFKGNAPVKMAPLKAVKGWQLDQGGLWREGQVMQLTLAEQAAQEGLFRTYRAYSTCASAKPTLMLSAHHLDEQLESAAIKARWDVLVNPVQQHANAPSAALQAWLVQACRQAPRAQHPMVLSVATAQGEGMALSPSLMQAVGASEVAMVVFKTRARTEQQTTHHRRGAARYPIQMLAGVQSSQVVRIHCRNRTWDTAFEGSSDQVLSPNGAGPIAADRLSALQTQALEIACMAQGRPAPASKSAG